MRLIVNGQERSSEAGSLAELWQAETGATAPQGFAIALNGDVVRRDAWTETGLRDGDHGEGGDGGCSRCRAVASAKALSATEAVGGIQGGDRSVDRGSVDVLACALRLFRRGCLGRFRLPRHRAKAASDRASVCGGHIQAFREWLGGYGSVRVRRGISVCLDNAADGVPPVALVSVVLPSIVSSWLPVRVAAMAENSKWVKEREVWESDTWTRPRVSGARGSQRILSTSFICWHRGVNREALRVRNSCGWWENNGDEDP